MSLFIFKIILIYWIWKFSHFLFFRCLKLSKFNMKIKKWMQSKIFMIQNSIISLRNSCFKKCLSLISFTILKSMKSLGINPFMIFHFIKSFTIPKSAKSLGNSCFEKMFIINVTHNHKLSDISTKQLSWILFTIKSLIILNYMIVLFNNHFKKNVVLKSINYQKLCNIFCKYLLCSMFVFNFMHNLKLNNIFLRWIFFILFKNDIIHNQDFCEISCIFLF
jgi:hypothetical protein